MKRLIWTLLALTSCSYQPEDAGLCKLNCSKAIIGSNDPGMSIKLQSSTSNIICSAANANKDSVPIVAQFLVSEKVATNSGDGQRPVPNLSFDPIVNGARSTSERNVINAGKIEGTDVYENIRYIGIPTPSSNWCSDSCGVATIEVTPLCPPSGKDSEVSIQLHTGPLYSDPVTFKISTE